MNHDGDPGSFSISAYLACESASDDQPEAVSCDLSPGDLDQVPQAQTGEECKDPSAAPSNTPIEPGPDSGIKRTVENAEALLYGESTPSDAESPMESESERKDRYVGENPASPPILDSEIPPPKRYAHHGKRRRKFTEELFRCPCVDKISRSDLVCNSLLWRNRPDELRAHLQEHLTVDQIGKMTDAEVTKWYVDAKRIFLQGIPEDLEEDEDPESDTDAL
jgi:hypothetical protein